MREGSKTCTHVGNRWKVKLARNSEHHCARFHVDGRSLVRSHLARPNVKDIIANLKGLGSEEHGYCELTMTTTVVLVTDTINRLKIS
jgi:hypothetical protein